MTKHWYQSLTMIVNVIAIIGIILNAKYGIQLDAETQAVLATGVLAIINIILRVKTNTGITK